MALAVLARPVAKPAKTTIWYTRCPVPSAWGIALRAGHFHEEFADDPHFAFRSVLDSSDRSDHDAHYYGTLANAFRLGGNIPPIWARSRGAGTRVVGISWTTTPSPILALPESNIRKAADLKGKRLLIVRRPEEEIDFSYAGTLRNYEIALATAGLTLDDVKLVEKTVGGSTEHSKPRQAAAGGERKRARRAFQKHAIVPLLLGEVDVITSQGPAAINLIDGFGLEVVHDISTHPDPIQRIHNSVPKLLTVDSGLIEENPGVVARILARLLEIPAWAKANREEAVHFIALEQGVADDSVEAAYGEKLAPELELNLSEENIARVAAQKTFLLKHGLIEKDFNLDEWIDARPLEAARALVEQRRHSHRAATSAKPNPVRVGPAGCVSK